MRREALETHRRAGTVASQSGSRYEFARALVGTAHARAALGDRPDAVVCGKRALAIFRELRVPEADQVATLLNGDFASLTGVAGRQRNGALGLVSAHRGGTADQGPPGANI